jgi:uncharacterized protein
MANYLAEILKLQTILQELSAAQQQISGIPDWMRELHQEHAARLAEIDALEKSAEEARGERQSAEAAIADEQEKLKRYQQQIHQVSTQREYGALLSEIDTTKSKINTAEDQGLGAMERREKAESQLGEARQAFADLDARYQAELARWEGEKPAIAARITELTAAAEVLKGALPRGVVTRFERLRERYFGNAVATIMEVVRPGKGPRSWHCSACNYSVRPQVVVEVRTVGTLLECDSCRRILYMPEAPA